MALKWFDASEAEKFGQSLAQLFIAKVPAVIQPGQKTSIAEQLKVVDQAHMQIEQFKQKNKLNIYKKAKLGSAFKYELMAAGYQAELVDNLTKGVLLKL
ncbi:MAG TPA: hypothetical protein VKC56_11725 [Gallionellaceae bacterium]|nr:hypothetical protein [Gallionellaceae bacterium]